MFATTTFFNKSNLFHPSLKDYALKSTYDSIKIYIHPKFEKKPYNISFPHISSPCSISTSIEENNNPSLPFLSIAFISSILGFMFYYRNKK